SGLSRREILANAALVGAGVAIGPLWFASCGEQSRGSSIRGDKALARGGDEMKTRKLGALEVSEMGAGCMSISANSWCPQQGSPARESRGQRSAADTRGSERARRRVLQDQSAGRPYERNADAGR